MSTTTPRINSALVLQHIGQTVRIVGTVQGYDDTKQHLSILASDGGSVIVIVAAQNVGVTWEAGQVLEIIGQAQGNAQPTITEYTSIPFAKNFDMGNYEKLVQLINTKYTALFH